MSFNIADYTIVVPLLNFIIIGVFAAAIVVNVAAMVRIVQRAGYNGWWFLIVLVPILNMLALWYFAFGPWPVFTGSERTK